MALEAPFEPASVAYVARVRLPSGAPAVLKVNAPDDESEREPDALRHWTADAAVGLLDDDPGTRSLLLELCEPGETLWSLAEPESLPIAAAVLASLHRRPPAMEHPFRLLDDEAPRWADELPRRWRLHGRPFDRRLLDRAVADIAAFVSSTDGRDRAVLHQDLHGGNILRMRAGGHDRWVAIDPKPLVGDPAFDAASLLRDRRAELAADPAPVRRIRRRLDTLAELTGLDRERMREWGIVHALAWGMDDDAVLEMHVRCAEWLARA